MNDAMLQTILLVVMFIISVALTGVILLQRSEGGALGMGSGNSGFMTARGAGNLLTRVTAILGAAFFVCAIALTIAGNVERGSRSVIDADAVGSIATGGAATAPQAEQPAEAAPAKPSVMSLDELEASLPAAAPAPAKSEPAQ